MAYGAVLALAAVIFVRASFAQHRAALTSPVVSERACPAEVIAVPTLDGHQATAVVRKPPGRGPFPAVIYLHGGLEPQPVSRLKGQTLTAAPTLPRFLTAGYVVVDATFRSRGQDPLTADALTDCLAIVGHVKAMPEVDPKCVVWGDSGGGSLALELAGETLLCAVAAQEPATVLFTGMYTKENLGGGPPFRPDSGRHIMNDPKRFFTPDVQQRTREKVGKIQCPVFIAHSNKHPINKINNEIIVPELKAAGKTVDVILYPGEPHGFSHGAGTPQAARKFFEDCHTFFRRHLRTQPTPLDESLVTRVPIE
jgi:dipeptidyl aminopeptidase/acylaminoacyl peptidase